MSPAASATNHLAVRVISGRMTFQEAVDTCSMTGSTLYRVQWHSSVLFELNMTARVDHYAGLPPSMVSSNGDAAAVSGAANRTSVPTDVECIAVSPAGALIRLPCDRHADGAVCYSLPFLSGNNDPEMVRNTTIAALSQSAAVGEPLEARPVAAAACPLGSITLSRDSSDSHSTITCIITGASMASTASEAEAVCASTVSDGRLARVDRSQLAALRSQLESSGSSAVVLSNLSPCKLCSGDASATMDVSKCIKPTGPYSSSQYYSDARAGSRCSAAGTPSLAFPTNEMQSRDMGLACQHVTTTSRCWIGIYYSSGSFRYEPFSSGPSVTHTNWESPNPSQNNDAGVFILPGADGKWRSALPDSSSEPESQSKYWICGGTISATTAPNTFVTLDS